MTSQTSSGEAVRKTSTLAIVSLVASVLGLTYIPIIGSIVAVVTGPMAKNEISASGGSIGGEGLATAGQVIGWVGLVGAMIGLCVGGTFFLLSLCATLFGVATQGLDLIIPALWLAF
jgi:hypothetical protein